MINCKMIKRTLLALTLMAASVTGFSGNSVDEIVAKSPKVVCIDAGHQTRAMSATEPNGPGSSVRKAKVTGGASGVSTHLPEYKLNLIVAKKLRKELISRGYKVVMVRTKNNVRLSNVQRAKIANKVKADAFVRIHANSAGASSVKGALTIAPTNANKYLTSKVRKKSIRFSRKMIREFCKATGAKNRGVLSTDSMTGINWCKIPVTIIEMGFMSNPAEDRLMASKKYQRKMVRGIANGVDAFLS
ncbi:N-acetylmuramoyl-L-alanine amidase [Eubacterium xylanophilum]|uniref:N-acetylmuramoyl-L-alanine amidase n=1 Tax=Eubacterium xylanophilum TaxID=39497 RepID=UPI0004B2CFD0|nr:N-acetylmuramoyl-L-alanine amidase [Eubacterium xylanophilum]